jgi:hypothetical protein
VRAYSRDRVCLAITVALAATGCSTRDLVARFVPPATDQYARRFIDTLQNQPAQAAVKLLVSRVAMEDGIVDSIATLQRHIPQGRPDSLQIVDVNWQTQNGSTRRTIAYQMHASGKWALIQVVLDDTGADERRVEGIRVWPMDSSLQSRNAMTLQHASTAGVVAALLGIVVFVFSLYAAVQVVRSPLKRRWVWVIVALVGFGKFGVEWRTGTVTQQWIAVYLFGTGIGRDGLYGPWWIFLSMPGGAVLALDRRRRAIAGQAQARAALAAVATPPWYQTEPGPDGT